MDSQIEKEELLPYLKERFKDRIKPEVISVKMVQTNTEVYLEYSLSMQPEMVNKVDIKFIASPSISDDGKVYSVPEFNPDNDLNENVHLFLSETDDYTVILAIDQIFTPDGIEEIIDESVEN
jgi:D-serine dehydratase